MTNVVHFMQSEDRKALEVMQSLLAYAQRELGDLKTPQPQLAAVVENALQLSSVILGENGSGLEIPTHRARGLFEQ
jgi:hypothetical protein